MDLFHEIPESHAILLSKGTFRQVPLFRRGEGVYAKSGSGFIRLLPNGATTVPTILWKDFDAGTGSIITKGCYLVYRDEPDTISLAAE